ncbi:hypothetical protein [uncultured Bradyrhizobium sp.]|jgi:hypothetical protein|uniref:hypothetical protein n=1 Tax=uncultured Bradyrhizobium sp. TaxID=199684 RepID=UPI00262C6661|nr:hypothetical protein [uncultured Bradyrhizobium sp.]
MSNFFDLICPKCGADDRIEIAMHVWARVTEDGTDTDLATNGDHEFCPQSPAICTGCGLVGTVRLFERAGEQT